MTRSVATNHPILDGRGIRKAPARTGRNKRVAFFVTASFFRLNGHIIDCDSPAIYDDFMRRFDTSSFRFTELRDWLTSPGNGVGVSETGNA